MGSKFVESGCMGKYNNLMKKMLNYNMNKFRIVISSILIFNFLMTCVIAESDIINEFWSTNGYDWGVRLAPYEFLCYATRDRPKETGTQTTKEKAIEIAKNFMNKNIKFFGIESYQFFDIKLKDSGSFYFWTIDFVGKMHEDLPPPEIYIRILMTSDGQPYAIGDIDAYNTEIGDLIKPLISENKAIALAKQYSGSNEEPTNYKITNDEDDRLVWDIKFSAPENKEVLIDAKTGNLISIKKTENLRQLELLNKQSYNPFLMITFFIIVVAIILVMFVFIKRMRRSGIKDSEMELNQ